MWELERSRIYFDLPEIRKGRWHIVMMSASCGRLGKLSLMIH
jgi:hypothetical protein